MRVHGCGLTWHPVEEPSAAAVIRLQVFAVRRPVHVCDEAVRGNALAHFLVPLHHSIDVHCVLIRADSQVSPIGGVLQLMNSLLPVLDVYHFCHVPKKKGLSR